MLKKFTLFPLVIRKEVSSDFEVQASVGYARIMEIAAEWFKYASLGKHYAPPTWMQEEREALHDYFDPDGTKPHSIRVHRAFAACTRIEAIIHWRESLHDDGNEIYLDVRFFNRHDRDWFFSAEIAVIVATAQVPVVNQWWKQSWEP